MPRIKQKRPGFIAGRYSGVGAPTDFDDYQMRLHKRWVDRWPIANRSQLIEHGFFPHLTSYQYFMGKVPREEPFYRVKSLTLPSSYKRRFPDGYRMPRDTLQELAYKASKRFNPKRSASKYRKLARNPFRLK